MELLMHGKLHKPCYFVLKNTRKKVIDFTKDVPDAMRLYDKNGFVFYKRNSTKSN